MTRIRRRQILIATGALLVAPRGWAQVSSKPRRIAFVNTTSPLAEIMGPEPVHPPFRALLKELGARGWVEGKNLILDRRSAEGRFERGPEIFSEVARSGAEVIVVSSGILVKDAMKSAPAVPIVMVVASPVEEGFVQSLARPGGNITGVTIDVGLEFHSKTLELVKDTLPKAKTIALLTTQFAGLSRLRRDAIHDAARTLKLDLFDAEWSNNAFDAAFKLIESKRPDALLVQQLAPHYARRAEIVNFARRVRLPDFYGIADAVEIGGLCSFGIDLSDMYRKAAGYVDRILKGAKPADLPIERPSKFELVINLKIAKALGLKIPQTLIQRADRVIE